MGNKSDQVTAVRIYNQTYNIRSGSDPDRTAKLAEIVDRRMNEISEQTPTVDTVRVAILAALNIASDYLAVKEALYGLEMEVTEKADKMAAGLKSVLPVEEDSSA